MGLYEYVGLTEKISRRCDQGRLSRRRDNGIPGESRLGRPEQPRGEFDEEHPQRETHIVRKRVLWVIPVLLADRIPRRDGTELEREAWARSVLLLFMPWRTPGDLKRGHETWVEAYERQSVCIPDEHMSIIKNMNVLAECKDARDRATAERR
ncbi:hypothetical protein C8Q80DRAFT_1101430, partial [Daedaleopsis nitida]